MAMTKCDWQILACFVGPIARGKHEAIGLVQQGLDQLPLVG